MKQRSYFANNKSEKKKRILGLKHVHNVSSNDSSTNTCKSYT